MLRFDTVGSSLHLFFTMRYFTVSIGCSSSLSYININNITPLSGANRLRLGRSNAGHDPKCVLLRVHRHALTGRDARRTVWRKVFAWLRSVEYRSLYSPDTLDCQRWWCHGTYNFEGTGRTWRGKDFSFVSTCSLLCYGPVLLIDRILFGRYGGDLPGLSVGPPCPRSRHGTE